MLGLTIDQAILLIALILIAGLLLGVFFGWREIRQATDLSYFLLRRERINRGWQLVGLGVVLGFGAVLVLLFGRRAAYAVIPPTPSATPTASTTPTPTMSLTPSITPTASITATPSITPTPTETGIPSVPDGISVLFRETITPNPEAAFSAPVVARQIDDSVQPVNPSESFEQPIGRLFGAFSYNNLDDGVRWTAIWYRGDEVICIETGPWDGGTGGFGFTECEPETPWLAGDYEIRLFIGLDWKNTSLFSVVGDPPTSTPEVAISETPTP